MRKERFIAHQLEEDQNASEGTFKALKRFKPSRARVSNRELVVNLDMQEIRKALADSRKSSKNYKDVVMFTTSRKKGRAFFRLSKGVLTRIEPKDVPFEVNPILEKVRRSPGEKLGSMQRSKHKIALTLQERTEQLAAQIRRRMGELGPDIWINGSPASDEELQGIAFDIEIEAYKPNTH